MSSGNWRIGSRIYAGFGVLQAVIIGLSVLAILGMDAIRVSFTSFGVMAGNTQVIDQLEIDIGILQLRTRDFMGSHRVDDLRRAQEAFVRLSGTVREAQARFTDARRQPMMDEVARYTEWYQGGLTKIGVLVGRRNEVLETVLIPLGISVQTRLADIISNAAAVGEADVAARAGLAQQQFLMARIHMMAYLDGTADAEAKAVHKEIKELGPVLDTLEYLVTSDRQRQVLTEARDEVAAFRNGFNTLVATLREGNTVRSDMLDRTGAQIAVKAATLRDDIRTEQAAVERAVAEAADGSEVRSVVLAILGVALSLGVAAVIGRGITRPITAMTNAMGCLARGELDTEVPGCGRGDEIGSMAGAVQVFKENAQAMERMGEEQKAAERRAEEEKQHALYQLADSFEASVRTVVQGVSASATQLESNAQRLSSTAEQSRARAAEVSASAQQTAANVHTVAASAEAMTGSISEITRQVGQSAQIAQQAHDRAEATNATIQTLAEQAKSIGDVVSLINDIASQTNLLALNATIEAARAGEAGKGFAVVAGEVKSLANQTAKATEDIGQQISAMQEATGSAVQAIIKISATIAEVNQIAATISAAVGQQDAATREITRNIQYAAQGAQAISGTIGDVQHAAHHTGAAAGEVLSAAQELSRQSDHLSNEVDRFIRQIRGA